MSFNLVNQTIASRKDGNSFTLQTLNAWCIAARPEAHRDPVFRQFVMTTGHLARMLIDQMRRVLLVPPSCLPGPRWFGKSYEDGEEKVGQFESIAKVTLLPLPGICAGRAQHA